MENNIEHIHTKNLILTNINIDVSFLILKKGNIIFIMYVCVYT